MTTLSPEQVYQIAQYAFGDLGPNAVETMTRIALAESGGNTAAVNGSDPYGGSTGLWQINGVHGYDPQALMDPLQNALAARQVLDQQGPGAWSTYTNGDYAKQVLPPSVGSVQSMDTYSGTPTTDPTAPGDLWSWLNPLPHNWPLTPPKNPTQPGGGALTPEQINTLLGGDSGGSRAPSLRVGGNGNYWDFSDPAHPLDTGIPAGTASGASTSRTPVTRSIGGVLYQFNPDADSSEAQWTPVAGSPTGTAGGGFTLSPGQARYDANGNLIAAGGSTADPYAQIKLQQAQTDLQIKQQNLAFLQDKFAFESAQGLRKEALDTQQQIFSQTMAVRSLQNNIDQFNARMTFDTQQANIANERARQQQLQGLASDIGTLAQDPGDRAKLASTILADSSWGHPVTGDMRTPDSLMPLEALLRQRQDLMGGTPQVSVPTVPGGALGGGLNLGAVMQPPTTGAPTPGTAQAQVAPAPNQPGNFVGNDPNHDATLAASLASTVGTPAMQSQNVNGTQVGGLADFLKIAQQQAAAGIPMKAGGGVEDGAYISGEAGPEINIPLGDGRVVVLNHEQAKTAGINLDKVMKMAGGGLFDGLIKDDNRDLATGFLGESTRRALSGTPWASGNLPGPQFESSPGFDPLVAALMDSIRAQATGIPAAYSRRQAALLAPAGVNENVIRRTA